MASSLIHLAVAKKVNEVIRRDEKKILFGSVSPDISQCLGQTKLCSHFLDGNGSDNIPNMDRFLKKYKKNLNDDFVLWYYIHLYTDYFWFKFFLTEIVDNNDMITKLDGEKVKLNGLMLDLYVYNDYTNLNIQLIEKYNLDLEFLYRNNINYDDILIEEIPKEKMEKLSESIVRIVKNTKIHKTFIFNIYNIEQFINTSSKLITEEILNMKI